MWKVSNILTGDERKFVLMRGLPCADFTVKAKGVRKARKVDPLSLKAGDGNFGFPSRHQSGDPAKMTNTIDGTGFKSARKSVVRPRKNVCLLATSAEVHRASIDPLVRQEGELASKKAKRARNRNRKAGYHAR